MSTERSSCYKHFRRNIDIEKRAKRVSVMNKLKKIKLRCVVLYMITAFLYVQFYGTVSVNSYMLFASENKSCESLLNLAEEKYYDGEFDKGIQLVHQCLQETSGSHANLVRGYTILVRIFLAKEETDSAKTALLNILKLEPDYQPTIEKETPKYVNFVTEVREEQSKQAALLAPSGKRKWLWIGAGGAAAVAIIAIVASGNGGGDNPQTNRPLPEPPSFP
jgi:hypothetical protein